MSDNAEHNDQRNAKNQKTKQSDAVDEASWESFPASDPPSHTPVTGVGGSEEADDIEPPKEVPDVEKKRGQVGNQFN